MMDKYIGKILDKLDELGLSDNTLVVFTTDHGHFFGQHGLQAKGGFHYEDLIKLPFIVRYPDQVPAGKVSNAIQSLVDLAPTFLSFCNLPIPSSMTGVDQKTYGLAARNWRETTLFANLGMSRRQFIKRRTSIIGIKLRFTTIRLMGKFSIFRKTQQSFITYGANRDVNP